MKNYTKLNATQKLELSNPTGLSLRFLANGNLAAISYHNLMLNLNEVGFAERSVANLYLRILANGKVVASQPLIGVGSASSFAGAGDLSAHWLGEFAGLQYQLSCQLSPSESHWWWSLEVSNLGVNSISYDVIYVQDVGLADVAAIRSNEAYVSQYIDHQALRDPEYGYAIASRQNLAQNVQCKSCYPWLLQGGLNSLSPISNYCSDGFQFYGLSSKVNGVPAALSWENLPSTVLQYEYALVGLQEQRHTLASGATQKSVFYAGFMLDHPSVSSLADLTVRSEIAHQIEALSAAAEATLAHSAATSANNATPVTNFAPIENRLASISLLAVEDLSAAECQTYFSGEVRHAEYEDGQLLSFFYSPDYPSKLTTSRHVVLRAKELLLDRSHGHILFSGVDDDFARPRLATTNYIFGLFNAQITLGNTSFNKLLSVSRSALNVFKTSGQRIFMRHENGDLCQLGIPSAYEVGVNFTRWIYKTAQGSIEVKIWTASHCDELYLTINASFKAQFYISHNLVAGESEDDSQPLVSYSAEQRVIIRPAASEILSQYSPSAQFYLQPHVPSDVAEIVRGEFFSAHSGASELPYVVYVTRQISSFGLTIGGSLSAAVVPGLVPSIGALPDFAQQVAEFEALWFAKINHFHLSHPSQANTSKFNDLMVWYLHNALVHYLVPHGLEQYIGAAWGTRDVCQGPLELFLTLGQFSTVRKILLTIFQHQYLEGGGWPQWFMFDEYYRIQQHESHGDVIVWPLKALFDYLDASQDHAILTELLPYTLVNGEFSAERATLLAHVERVLAHIQHNFMPNTHLSCYGDGDWDDTLQPADAHLRKSMVSGWTVQLTYQTFVKGGQLLASLAPELGQRFSELATQIRVDYNRLVIQDGVAAGFILFEDEQIRPLLHPKDNYTGIQYRLLPMTRGIISELFTPEQALKHYQLIKQHLYYSDGVRLMNRPATYVGGVNRIFKRAELAANVGREVGLQYVHAHIRFIEAMAKLGKADEVWLGLQQINPISIRQVVPNAAKRQSNSYFSSSDADFATREQASRNWQQLKTAEVSVRGGWRIYSSGPGIYINQLISNFLGIRFKAARVELDPVIPEQLDGLLFNYRHGEHEFEFKYHLAHCFAPQRIVLNQHELKFQRMSNPYRLGGIYIERLEFDHCLLALGQLNQVEIYV